jgi:hypothetical protein
MRDLSPYEGLHDKTGIVCLGEVKSVDNFSRRVRVKTIGMPGGEDLDLYHTRVLHGMWHPEGDEEVSLPRVGTFGVVIFIGSESFWIGACPLDMGSAERQRTNQETLLAGDSIVKTIAGNKIIVRSGGTIEIQSTDICRTFWIPSQNLISSVCQNFELETAGGHIMWNLDKAAGTTNLKLKAWNSLRPDNGVTMNIGTIPESNQEESEDAIQPFAPADMIIDFKQGTLDNKLDFSKRSLRMSVKKDGSIYFDVGPGKFTLKVDAETGNVDFETKGKVSATIKDDVTLNVDGAVTATVKKDITLNADSKVTANIKSDMSAVISGKASISAKGGATIQTDGNAEITAKGNVVATASGNATVSANGKATISGKGGTEVGTGASPTMVQGATVGLGGGGLPVSRLSDQTIGTGNMGAPVVAIAIAGSPKVTSA